MTYGYVQNISLKVAVQGPAVEPTPHVLLPLMMYGCKTRSITDNKVMLDMVKGKAIPVTGCGRPYGYGTFDVPTFSRQLAHRWRLGWHL
jgi:hypothetical protein